MGQTKFLNSDGWLILITIIFCFFMGSLTACKKVTKIDGSGYKTYTISKHKSTYKIETLSDHTLSGYAKFTSSCEYELTDNIGQINKLIGLSDGTDHHDNSLRIGWEYADNLFRLYAYYYIDGVRGEKFITSVEVDERFDFIMSIGEDSYNLFINDKLFSVAHNIIERKKSYTLFPYFGGKEPFPGSIYGDNVCTIYMNYSTN